MAWGATAEDMEFPEFLQVHTAAVCQFADVAQQYFDRLVAKMPDFASYVSENPRPVWNHGSGKRNRKRRISANQRWRRDTIYDFLLKVRGPRAAAMRQMHELVSREVPSWLALPDAPVEMALAA